MPTNTIDSELQLTKTLEAAMRGFKRGIMPVDAICSAFRNTPLMGNERMTVPYYPLSTTKSRRREPRGSYKALASNTSTESRSIDVNRNLLQAISFTGEELSRQPFFDPDVHGELKGEQLALDILAEILSPVSAGNFVGETLAATTAANFDEEDVADLAGLCDEAEWPEAGRSLLVRPRFKTNVIKQPALLDLSQSGSSAPLRTGQFGGNLFGFTPYSNTGVPTNNWSAAVALTAVDASGDTVTIADADGNIVMQNGDRVVFATSDADLPAGLSVDTFYYVKAHAFDATARTHTFQVSATVGGSAVNITDAGTGTHTVRRYESLGGMAIHRSALLAGFCPVEPSRAMRERLHDYRIIPDSDGGNLCLEYRHFVEPDTNEEVQVIEAHFGVGLGELAAVKRIIDSALLPF